MSSLRQKNNVFRSDISRLPSRKGLIGIFLIVVTCVIAAPQKFAGQRAKMPASPPKYDCIGDLPRGSKTTKESRAAKEYVDNAIDDALKILDTCPNCRRMFDSEDRDYAIRLLSRLRQNNAIIISERVPTTWQLSASGSLRVKASEKLDSSGAGTIDLLKYRGGEMQKPCIYVNASGFMATGERAEDYALFPLEPSLQRAVALLHELGHVAGVLQSDADEANARNGSPKSTANTDCVRENCITCSAYKSCPNVPEPHHAQPARPRANHVLSFFSSLPLENLFRATVRKTSSWLALPFTFGIVSLLFIQHRRRRTYSSVVASAKNRLIRRR